MDRSIRRMIKEHIDLFVDVEESLSPKIRMAAEWMIDTLESGNKILFAGNGGSASDAQHLAAEFIGRFSRERRSLPAIALTTDTSILTALGNDYGFDKIFSRQVEGLAKEGDLFIGISTSGNSGNLMAAVEECKVKTCKTIGFLGRDGGKLGKMVDLPIVVESKNTARIQEFHIMMGHILCDLVEKQFARETSEGELESK
ncbi:MAG: SIS domain-containing protein [Waddliaceae bacterium]